MEAESYLVEYGGAPRCVIDELACYETEVFYEGTYVPGMKSVRLELDVLSGLVGIVVEEVC